MKKLLLSIVFMIFFVSSFCIAWKASYNSLHFFDSNENYNQLAFNSILSTAQKDTYTYNANAEQADHIIYMGKVYHIFFHSLIIYPEIAFKSQNANGYNSWMTTRDEFKRILEKLYENEFVLVDIDYVFQAKGKGFLFPKGKKPLVISVDDVNYYEYMQGDGFAEKLVVDNEGNVATKVRGLNNKVTIHYEGDVVPILDSFVEKHPDFSFKGAKGILGVTGFDGVFGYRITKLKGNALKVAQNQAKRVAISLKKSGWKIACHSFNHSIKFKDGTITLSSLKSDIEKWNQFIAPVTGKTNIFIAPFGVQFQKSDNRFKYLCGCGFNIYCSVFKRMGTNFTNGTMISERLNFDGFTMLKYPNRITSCFFDLDGIIDETRPCIL